MKVKKAIKGTLVIGLTSMAVLAILAGIFVGCGHRGYRSGFEDPERRMEWVSSKIADRLDLTADQKAKVEAMLSDLHEKRREGRPWRQAAKQDIVKLVRQEQIGQDDINRLVETYRQRMDKMVAYAGDRVIEFHALLTPAQREKLAIEIENHKHGHWRQCRFKKW